jgi:ribulose-phosphate 3-epimerase
MIIIEPSLLSADCMRMGEQAREAEAAGAEALQIDVMDGRFVPDITFGADLVRALRSTVKAYLDVHLMIVEPERHLARFVEAGADRLVVHQEVCPHLHRILQTIDELGVKAGVAINPGTPPGVLDEVLDLVDVIQVMTVNPGFGGQPFIYSQVDKVRRVRDMVREAEHTIAIAVDGGISPETAPLVVEAGATVLVAGSSIYNEQGTVAQNFAALRDTVVAYQE